MLSGRRLSWLVALPFGNSCSIALVEAGVVCPSLGVSREKINLPIFHTLCVVHPRKACRYLYMYNSYIVHVYIHVCVVVLEFCCSAAGT